MIPQQLEMLIMTDREVDHLCSEIQKIIRLTPGVLSYNKYERAGLYLKMRTRLHTRLHCIMLLATTPGKNEIKSTKLPPMLYPLLRITRPFRLISKLIRHK
jgi:hypothetical protein